MFSTCKWNIWFSKLSYYSYLTLTENEKLQFKSGRLSSDKQAFLYRWMESERVEYEVIRTDGTKSEENIKAQKCQCKTVQPVDIDTVVIKSLWKLFGSLIFLPIKY